MDTRDSAVSFVKRWILWKYDSLNENDWKQYIDYLWLLLYECNVKESMFHGKEPSEIVYFPGP